MRSKAVVVMAALSAALATGGWFVGHGLEGQAAPGGARLYQDVLQHVAQFYVDSIPPDQLFEKSAAGMTRELGDPHSAYLTPERLKRFTESTSGNYAGIGARVDVRDGWVTIIDPIPGAAAERAGLQPGDRIIEIAGESTRGWTADEATRRLRGTPGTRAQFVVERPGVAARIPVSVTREDVHIRSVQRVALLRDGIGYLDVNVFSGETAAEVRQAVDSLRRLGAKSVVLDLRGNPGGLLDQGVSVADLFLQPGQSIVRMRGRTPEANQTYLDRNPAQYGGLPLVVLIDGGSASASEIVAGALQDHDRALIMGATSYGKGSAQALFPLPESGGALKLTTALWYTPVGRSINRPIDAKAADDDDQGDDVAPPADTTKAKPREAYRTDAGRTVYGGGGITPDVVAGDTAATLAELAFVRALGEKVRVFRDAVTAEALAIKGSGTLKGADFPVTPAMLESLYGRMKERGVAMDRATYEGATPLVSRQLAYETARYAFGADAEFRRRAADDAAINSALALASGVATQKDLFARAAALPKKSGEPARVPGGAGQ